MSSYGFNFIFFSSFHFFFFDKTQTHNNSDIIVEAKCQSPFHIATIHCWLGTIVGKSNALPLSPSPHHHNHDMQTMGNFGEKKFFLKKLKPPVCLFDADQTRNLFHHRILAKRHKTIYSFHFHLYQPILLCSPKRTISINSKEKVYFSPRKENGKI